MSVRDELRLWIFETETVAKMRADATHVFIHNEGDCKAQAGTVIAALNEELRARGAK